MAALPAIAAGLSLAQTVFPGLLGGQQAAGVAQAPLLDAPKETNVDRQIVAQTEKNRELRRLSATKSKTLTNIQDNPIGEDSLLRLVAEGRSI
jgi:hypothetical protein